MASRFSEEDPIAAAIAASVDAGVVAGAATLVSCDGEVIRSAAVGCRDLNDKVPVERETLFRIASMTKPITSTAALMLLVEGRFRLSDSVARWAPEFSNMRVLRSPDGPLDDTAPAKREITFEDLLTHRAGFTYAGFHTGPIARAYAEALGGDIDTDVAPDAWIAELAALPLVDQPGAAFHYGHSTDLLGLLIARIESKPLGDVLQRRIFDPLGMTDTSFIVPRAKRRRWLEEMTRLFNLWKYEREWRRTGEGSITVRDRRRSDRALRERRQTPFAVHFRLRLRQTRRSYRRAGVASRRVSAGCDPR